MLFRRRYPARLSEKMRELFWPRKGLTRPARYFAKRVMRLGSSPYSVAVGVAVGVAAAWTPVLGFHILLALFLSYFVGGNLVAAALGTAFANPLTLPFIWASSWEAGNWLLGNRLTVQVMSSALAKTPDRTLRKWIHEEHHRYFSKYADLATVVESFEASTSADVSEYGPNIAVPTLLIGAELDLITPVAALHALQSSMADAELHVIDGVGHLIHYEKAEIAAAMIVDFLGDGSVVDA